MEISVGKGAVSALASQEVEPVRSNRTEIMTSILA
jgi:hypothetical protein